MSAIIIPFQPSLQPALPTVEGNVDYRQFRDELCRIDEILRSGPEETFVVAATLRTRYFAVPARLVNRSGRPTLRLPTRWPWALRFSKALTNLRAVAFAPT